MIDGGPVLADMDSAIAEALDQSSLCIYLHRSAESASRLAELAREFKSDIFVTPPEVENAWAPVALTEASLILGLNGDDYSLSAYYHPGEMPAELEEAIKRTNSKMSIWFDENGWTPSWDEMLQGYLVEPIQ